ncbi:MAG: DUF4105 domain-containing protein [Paludibacteraceae bacterium]|nr:DUF4105 domain-containing protein [Paludibacteraceae bacterium]
MMFWKRFYIGLVLFLGVEVVFATTLSDDAAIYLITCTPDKPLYLHYGHTAIKVKDSANDLDLIFNYGTFSFNTEHFYWNFLRGNTWYELSVQDAFDFYREYKRRKRTIFSQELDITQEQKQAFFDALIHNYHPQNRHYLYNFVFDNCATRPFNLLLLSLQADVRSVYFPQECTYRQLISKYSGPYSWGDWGINLIFGRDADKIMSVQERIFLPEELMNYVANAVLPNDKKLVKTQYIGTFPPAVVPWYQTVWVGIIAFALLVLGMTWYDYKKQKITWWFDAVCFFLFGLLGCLLVFLSYFSIHPLVTHNWNLLLYNPLLWALVVLCLKPKGKTWIMKNAHFFVGYLIAVLAIDMIVQQGQMVVSCLFPIIHIAIRSLKWGKYAKI